MTLCTREDIETIYGTINVSKWADMNNNGNATEIAAKIERAIVVNTDEFYSRIRMGPYLVPFADLESGEEYPPVIVDTVARMCGIWLYAARGFEDTDDKGKPVSRLSSHEKKCDQVISDLLNRRLSIDMEYRTKKVPFIVKDTTPAETAYRPYGPRTVEDPYGDN